MARTRIRHFKKNGVCLKNVHDFLILYHGSKFYNIQKIILQIQEVKKRRNLWKKNSLKFDTNLIPSFMMRM